jgi:hypothetical protein
MRSHGNGRGGALGVDVGVQQEAGTRHCTLTAPPEVVTVVSGGWGTVAGQLGMTTPEEGSPEGQKSFAVDAQGRIHVLDQVNQRVQSFEAGKSTGVLALPDRPFEDLEVDAGGFLLLDLFQTPAIVGLGLDGVVSGELPVPAEEIPEPGLVTALDKSESGSGSRSNES